MVRARPLSRLVRRLTMGAAWAAFASLALVAAPASAGERLVVVVDVDPRVSDALVVALSPWSLTVVRSPGPAPSSDLDASSSRASSIATEQHAGAVVWIAAPRGPGEQATLWVYDAQTKQLAVRPLSVSAPFDDAGAAAVALSVKTILRASPLATEESSPEPPSSAPPAMAPEAASSDRDAETGAHAQSSASTRAWRFETILGVRAPTGAGAAVEPRAALGASLWPGVFGDHAGLGLAIQAGPGVSVGTGSFQGELREGSVEVTARLRKRAGRWMAFELECGPALFLTSLAGQASDGTHLHALRLDPAVNLGAIADLSLGARVSLGLLLEGSALFRFQRYSLDGAPLLDGPAVLGLAGLRLSLEVD